MNLNKKEKDGVTYIELYICCPECYDKGIPSKDSFVVHKDCGGSIYIGDNASYLCDSCNSESFVQNWKIHCDCESESIQMFESNESLSDFIHIQIAGLMVHHTGVEWLQRFTHHLSKDFY